MALRPPYYEALYNHHTIAIECKESFMNVTVHLKIDDKVRDSYKVKLSDAKTVSLTATYVENGEDYVVLAQITGVFGGVFSAPQLYVNNQKIPMVNKRS